jgi:hypothetical protein
MRIKAFLYRTFFLTLPIISCKSLPPNTARTPGSWNRVADISIGDPKKVVVEKLGTPSSKNVEKYRTSEYETLEYSEVDGIPLGYISLDSKTEAVAGRAIWIPRSRPEGDFAFLQKQIIPEGKFNKTLVSCDKHHWAEFKVDTEKGIFVGIDRNGVFLISWSNPELTKLRVEQFFLKCPEAQQPKRTQL